MQAVLPLRQLPLPEAEAVQPRLLQPHHHYEGKHDPGLHPGQRGINIPSQGFCTAFWSPTAPQKLGTGYPGVLIQTCGLRGCPQHHVLLQLGA